VFTLAHIMKYVGAHNEIHWCTSWNMLVHIMKYVGAHHEICWCTSWNMLAHIMKYVGAHHEICWRTLWNIQVIQSNNSIYEVLNTQNWNIVPCFSLYLMLELTVQYKNITEYGMLILRPTLSGLNYKGQGNAGNRFFGILPQSLIRL